MNENLTIHTERVDDVPLLLARMERMGMPALLDAQFLTHDNRQGLSLGWTINERTASWRVLLGSWEGIKQQYNTWHLLRSGEGTASQSRAAGVSDEQCTDSNPLPGCRRGRCDQLRRRWWQLYLLPGSAVGGCSARFRPRNQHPRALATHLGSRSRRPAGGSAPSPRRPP